MSLCKELTADSLCVRVYETRRAMGDAAGACAAAHLRTLLAEKDEVNVIFAAAPSQNEMVEALVAATDIDWTRVNAFHMDEYIGLPPTHRRDSATSLTTACFQRFRSRQSTALTALQQTLRQNVRATPRF